MPALLRMSDGFEMPPLPGDVSNDQPPPAPSLERASAESLPVAEPPPGGEPPPAAEMAPGITMSDGFEMPPLPGGAQPGGQDDLSMIRETGRGFVHGLTGMASAVNTAIEYAGTKTDSPSLQEFGRHGAEYWENVGKDWEAPEALQGNVFDNPELMAKGSWWAYNVAGIVPTLAASVLPGVGGAKAVQAFGNAVKWSPKAIERLARIGKAVKGTQADKAAGGIKRISRAAGAVTGGSVGGSMEGANTYQEVIKKGGTHEEAASAAELMTLASGVLNTLSVDRFLQGLPDEFLGRLRVRAVRGLTEGITEYLEGPAEAGILYEGGFITPEEAVQKLKEELNVLGPAVVTGFFFPGAGTIPSMDQAETPPPAPQPEATGALEGEDILGEPPPDTAAEAAPSAGTQDQTGAAPGVAGDQAGPPGPGVEAEAGPGEVPVPEVAKAPPAPNPNVPARRQINPDEDDLLAALAKERGLNREEAEAQGFDPADFGKRGWRIFRLFTKNGMSFDEAAEKLSQYNYPVTDENGNYSANMLVEALQNALHGKKIMAAGGMENLLDQAAGEREADRQYQQEMEDAGYNDNDINSLNDAYAAYIEMGEEAESSPLIGDITDIRVKYYGLLGRDAVDAIIERTGIQYADLSDADYVSVLEDSLRAEYDEQANPPQDTAGIGQDIGGLGAPAPGAPGPAGPAPGPGLAEPIAAPGPPAAAQAPGITGVSSPEVFAAQAERVRVEEEARAAAEAQVRPPAAPVAVPEPVVEPARQPKKPGARAAAVQADELGGGAVATKFLPSHELSDGTLVVQNTEDGEVVTGEWLDAEGNIIEDDYASPIEEPAAKPAKPTKQLPGKKEDLAGPVDEEAQAKKDAEEKAKKEQEAKEEAAEAYEGEPDLLTGGQLEPDLFAPENIDAAANEAATSTKNNLPEPTEAQKDVGNYKKGPVTSKQIPWMTGLTIMVENPAGTKRRPEWPALKNHYGYFQRSQGYDGDEVDVFLGDVTDDTDFYVIDQVHPKTRQPDEHKVVMMAGSEKGARAIYDANYAKDWNGFAGINKYSFDEFKEKLKAHFFKNSTPGRKEKKRPGKKPEVTGAEKPPIKAAKPAAPAKKAPGRKKPESVEKPAAAAKPKSKPAAGEKIEDFGEKLGGSRKDQAALLKDRVDKEYSDDDIAKLPLSKIWPKKDNDAIDDTFIAAFATAARAEIPSKPRMKYKVNRWVETVKRYRGLMGNLFQRIEGGELNKKLLAEKIAEFNLGDFWAKVELLQLIDREHWDKIGEVSEHPDAYRYIDSKQVPASNVGVRVDGRYLSIMDVKKSTDKPVIDKVNEVLAIGPDEKKLRFEVRGRTGRYFINKKGDSEYRPLKTFDNVKDAQEYRRNNYDALAKEWEAVKERDNVTKRDMRRDTNKPRTGKDYRKGKNADEDMFTEAFGFRGVEFGDWVKQGKNAKERQGMMNQAFDALMDLSNIVGIPSKAISLNGELGLGLGSRGHGWASAHYEPDTLVINLTKTRGAGAIGHEWFHALDNYFQRKRGTGPSRETSYITYNPETYYEHKNGQRISETDYERAVAGKPGRYKFYSTHNPDDWTKVEGVRPEVAEAFSDLVKTLNESPMKKRAAKIDKGTGYWSRIIERAARSFENYIISKMMQGGYENDYLANVAQIEEFSRDPGRYPYLLADEVAPVEQAFDSLFSTIESKETDQGVALFSRKQISIDELESNLEQKYKLKSLSLSESRRGDIDLLMIEVAKENRKQGIGSAVMKELTDYADVTGKRIVLEVGQKDDRHGTTSSARLKRFYKRFGFVENKGRNKDFRLKPGMYRDPIGQIRASRQESPSAGMSKAAVEKAIHPRWRKMKNRVPVQVVENYEDLPPVVYAKIKDEAVDIEGVAYKGKIYLVASQITSAERAQTVMFDHELRHIGLRAMLGQRLVPMLNQAWLSKEAPKIRAFANKAGIKIDTARRRQEAAEEYIVHLAETGQTNNLLQKLYHLIRNLLRNLGFNLTLSDVDMRQMVANAGTLMETGRGPVRGGVSRDVPMFSPAFHGSPHKFTKFDIEKIGTGEGAQAYGHGLYFAESEGVAKTYQIAISYRAWDIYEAMERYGVKLNAGGRGELTRQGQTNKDSMRAAKAVQNANVAARSIPQEKLATLIDDYRAKGSGSLYEVDIPDAAIEKMLDWDAPLSEQAESVKKALKENWPMSETFESWADEGMTGGQFYNLAAVEIGRDPATGKAADYVEVSKKLNSLGIPGIKYFDQQSRNVPAQNDRQIDQLGRSIAKAEKDIADIQAELKDNKNTTGLLPAYFKRKELRIAELRKMISEAKGKRKRLKAGENITRNFVVFDADIITVLKRDGEAVQEYNQAGTDTAAFEKWFGDSKVVDENGVPLVVYHGTNQDITEFDSSKTEDGGFHFGTSQQAGMRVAGEGKNIMPVYINAENLQRSKDLGGKWKAKIKSAKSSGKDGIIYLNRYEGISIESIQAAQDAGINPDKLSDKKFKEWFPEATDSYIAFEPTQIKSAIGNRGTFDPENPDIRFSRRTPGRQYTPEQEDAMDVGGFGESQAVAGNPLRQALGRASNAIDDVKATWKTILRQGFLDQYDSFRTILNDKEAWMKAELSAASGGAVEAALEYGQPFYRTQDGAIDVDVNKESLAKILEPLGAEVNDWLKWIAGNRAERLSAEDREHLFSDIDIDALKSLNQGTMEDGRNRARVYEAARVKFEEMNDAIIKIGVKTGIVTQKEQLIWKDQGFYVPFYRMMEATGDVRGPRSVGGLVKQTAYKRLKGADIPIGDLLTNTVMNWHHIIDAGLKNEAAASALETAENMGLSTEVSEKDATKDAVFVRVDGQKLFYELDSSREGQLVLESLVSLNWTGLNNFMMKLARKFKRLLTYGVTASPEFKVANLIRDSVQAIAVAGMSTKIHKNVLQGFRATKKGNPTIARMIAGGGAFGDSGYIHGSDPEALERLVAKDVDRMTILDSPKRIQKMWDAYQDFGARLENVNRAANFEQDLSNGNANLLEANFNARDHLDFQRNGAFVSIRALAQVVPFLNARLQGMSKLGRSGFDENQKKQFKRVMFVYAMAGIMLYLYMRGDDDFDEAPEWEKDAYHLFKIPGSDTMYRIPRPFEVGFFAAMAERGVQQLVDDEAHGALFAERLWHGLGETLSFNPMPQMVMPAVEVWANKNTFTDRPIESEGMKNLSPTERRRAWTSETAIGMSKFMGAVSWDKAVLSPVQIEHLVNGYLGWIGSFSLESADSILRLAPQIASAPSKRVQDYPVVGRFARTGPARSTRYTTEFYDQLRDASRIYADIRFKVALGDTAGARKLMKENRKMMGIRKGFTRVQKSISAINREIMVVRISKKYSRAEKLRKIDELNARKNELTEKMVTQSQSR